MKIKKRRNLKSLIRSGHTVERRTIRISTGGGRSHEVEAEVLGCLATHRAWEAEINPALFKGQGKKLGWVVTHVRTGCAVIGAIACATKKQAMQIMRECTGGPWDFGEFGKKSLSSRVLEARALVRAAGVRAGLKLKKERFVRRTVKRAGPKRRVR